MGSGQYEPLSRNMFKHTGGASSIFRTFTDSTSPTPLMPRNSSLHQTLIFKRRKQDTQRYADFPKIRKTGGYRPRKTLQVPCVENRSIPIEETRRNYTFRGLRLHLLFSPGIPSVCHLFTVCGVTYTGVPEGSTTNMNLRSRSKENRNYPSPWIETEEV